MLKGVKIYNTEEKVYIYPELIEKVILNNENKDIRTLKHILKNLIRMYRNIKRNNNKSVRIHFKKINKTQFIIYFLRNKKIILDILSDTFTISKDTSKDKLSIYKKVAIPKFEIIKMITIDEKEFNSIGDAQEYINDYLIVYADEVFDDKRYFDIKVLLTDKLEVFEATFDVTDAYKFNGAELSVDSLLDILLRPYDYFGDELPMQNSTLYHEVYTIELDRYKENDVGSIDLSFLYESIYTDMNKLLDRQGYYGRLSEDMVQFAFDVLESNYRDDINILRHTIDDESYMSNDIRNEISKKHDFSIPYDEDADKDSYTYYRIIILKLLAISDYQLKQKYTFSNREKIYDKMNILRFIYEAKTRLTIRESLQEVSDQTTVDDFKQKLDEVIEFIAKQGELDKYKNEIIVLEEQLRELI